jgi:hypothetical protein
LIPAIRNSPHTVGDAERPAERGQHRLQRGIARRDRQHDEEHQREASIDPRIVATDAGHGRAQS